MGQNTEFCIETVLRENLGLQSNFRGFLYLKTAVSILLEKPNTQITQLYRQIGQRYGLSAANVGKAICFIIERSYDKNNLNGDFSNTWGRPYNSEVIWRATELVKCRLLQYQ